MQAEIQKLLKKQVITKEQHEEGEFISNVFLREKREPGKFRMILDLTELNKFVVYRHFKMDMLETALNMVTPGCFFASIDYCDAYYSLQIARQHRKYFKFSSQGQLYQFNVVPNGLGPGSLFFTKVVKVPLSILSREHGILVSAYLEDSIYVNEDAR